MQIVTKVCTLSSLVIVLLAIAAAGPLMSQVEQPAYNVVHSDGSVEVRSYPPLVIAEVAVRGTRTAAIQQGFKIIAGYIFGANGGLRKIAMTAPVMQERKSSTTSDQTIEQADGDLWMVRFVMPKTWSLGTLPKPNDQRIALKEIPARTMAVIRFSGLARDASVRERTAALSAYLVGHELKPLGSPILAFFNPPWTLPFLRRNEVMIEVLKR